MKIKTKIEFVWNVDDESEDRLEKSLEEWSEYYKNLMVEDIETLVKSNKLYDAIKIEEEKENER